MNPTSIDLSEHQMHDMCHGDYPLIRKAGRFKATMLANPAPLLREPARFPDIPLLLVSCDAGQDPVTVQSMSDPECETRTFHATMGGNHTLLGILITGPVFSLAVMIDPHSSSGRVLLERWHATGRLLFSLSQRSTCLKVVELSCTRGASELLAQTAPPGVNDRVSVTAIALPRIHAELQRTLGSGKLILVAASGGALDRSRAEDEAISLLLNIAPTVH